LKDIIFPNVITEKNAPDQIKAYFTLSNDKIAVTDFDSNNQFNKFKRKNFSKEKSLRSYPSVKIGRLGISKELHGHGIGTHIMDFVKLYFLEDNKTGCRFVTVDAYNAAIPFYEKNGFQFLQSKDDSPTQLMYFDLMTVKPLEAEALPSYAADISSWQKRHRRFHQFSSG
jgi:GNAT superfamily N-acetyltransferase